MFHLLPSPCGLSHSSFHSVMSYVRVEEEEEKKVGAAKRGRGRGYLDPKHTP